MGNSTKYSPKLSKEMKEVCLDLEAESSSEKIRRRPEIIHNFGLTEQN